MECAKGPFAKRPPADWDRIQKECPNIIRKVHDSIESDYILTNQESETNKSWFSSYHCFTNKDAHKPFRDEQIAQSEHKNAPKYIRESAIRFNDDIVTRHNNREDPPNGEIIHNRELATSFNEKIAPSFKRELPPRFNREIEYNEYGEQDRDTLARSRMYTNRFNRETIYTKNTAQHNYNNNFVRNESNNYSDRNNNDFYKTSQESEVGGCMRRKMSFDMATFNRLCH